MILGYRAQRIALQLMICVGLASSADLALGDDGVPPIPTSGEAAPLFASVSDDRPEPLPQYLTLWSVAINEEAIRQPAATIRLNGPDMPEVEVPLLRWSPRAGYIEMYNKEDPDHPIIIPDPNAAPEDFSWSWYGKAGDVVVSLTVERGALAGRVWIGTRHYALRPSAEGLLLGETNRSYWRTHPDDGEGKSAVATASDISLSLPMPKPSQSGSWDFTCSSPIPAGQHVIDVLVLYTPGVLTNYASPKGVEVAVRTAIENANHALRNSGITSFVYSLRGVELLPNSEDYDTDAIDVALANFSGVRELTDPESCTFIGNNYVAARRNDQWADIVALARHDLSQNTCGVTFVQHGSATGCLYEPGAGFDQYAYLVFDPDCDADQLNLAHELGHQLGMEHDPRNSDMPVGSGNPSCPWSFAHRGTTVPYGFRTAMATPDAGNTFVVGPACTSDNTCPQIDAFANPQLQWTGASGGVQPLGTVPGAPPIGVATPPHQGYRARAVDTLPRLAPISAAFRARPEVIFADDFE